MPVLLIFLLVPIIEIALFVTVGDNIGLLATLLIVVVTAIFGSTLLRSQGTAILFQLKQSAMTGEDITQPILHGVLIFAAGLLLLTPGFLTDTVGFALLVPNIRYTLIQWGIDSFATRMATQTWFPNKSSDEDVIEGQARDVTSPPFSRSD